MLDFLLGLDIVLIFVILLFLMFTNGLFLFPSSQIILVSAGLLSEVLSINPVFLFSSLWFFNMFGNYILFVISYKYGEKTVRKIIPMNKDKLNDDILLVKYLFKIHGAIIIFIGRNLPVLHSVVSIPAGIAKVSNKVFFIYTGIGIFTWNFTFFFLGLYFGSNYENLMGGFNIALMGVLFLVTFSCLYYLVKYKKEFLKKAKASGQL